MKIIIFVALSSFLALVAMIANKIWHIRSGKINEPYDLHLVGPIIKFSVKMVHMHGMMAVKQIMAYAHPTWLQARKDMMLLGYDASATLAKRFAKLANAIKGKGDLPESRSAQSFMLAYAQKESNFEN